MFPIVASEEALARPVVLVHGGWHGGWHWDPVVDRLRRLGHRSVYAPTLAGMAELESEANEATGVQAQVASVVAVLDEHELTDVVLVGHSYGGFAITGAAHARPQRVSDLVYLDAFVPRDGESAADILGSEFAAAGRSAAEAAGTPFLVPPMFGAEANTGWTDERGTALEARMGSQPLATFFEPLSAPGVADARHSYIRCAVNSLGLVDDYAAAAQADPRRWRYFELPSPHDAVHVMPAAVAGVVSSITEGF